MADATMAPVRPLRVRAIELTHTFGEIGIRRLDQQMVMIAHQTVSVPYPVEVLDHGAENIKKSSPVFVVFIDRFAAVTSRGHVIQGSG